MSNPLGAGVSPVGVASYGYGTVATAPTPGGLVNRLNNGTQTGSPLISLDLGTRGQYVYDAFGRRKGQPDVEHMVTLALGTVRGSCIVPIGHRFREIRKVNENFDQEMKTRIEEALSPLLEQNLIAINGITVQPMRGQPSVTRVHLTDKTTGDSFTQII